jgi:hypothetical protein
MKTKFYTTWSWRTMQIINYDFKNQQTLTGCSLAEKVNSPNKSGMLERNYVLLWTGFTFASYLMLMLDAVIPLSSVKFVSQIIWIPDHSSICFNAEIHELHFRHDVTQLVTWLCFVVARRGRLGGDLPKKISSMKKTQVMKEKKKYSTE